MFIVARIKFLRDFGEELSGTASQETSKAHKPVSTDSLQEDLMPHRCHSLGRCNGEKLLLVGGSLEHTSVADDDAGNEQGSSEVAEECKEPVSQHEQDRGASMESCQTGVHETSSAEVCSSHDDNHQTEGEDEGAQHAGDTRSVLIEPGRGVNNAVTGTSEGLLRWLVTIVWCKRQGQNLTKRQPAMNEEMMVLSMRMWAL